MNALQFQGLIPVALVLPLMLVGMAGVWWYYYRESQYARNPYRWLLPTLRALAFGLILGMLCGPAWVREWVSGELSRIAVLLDTSASMELKESETSEALSRVARAKQWLESRSEQELGWLDQQRKRFHLRLFAFDHGRNDTTSTASDPSSLWDSMLQGREKVTRSVGPEFADGAETAIGDALSGMLRSAVGTTDGNNTNDGSENQESKLTATDARSVKPYAAVVVLSDGQSNAGEAPAAVAERFKQSGIPVFAIGYGRESEPEDLGVLAVDHSKTLFETDAFQGTVTLKQQLPAGETYRVEIQHDGQVVWSRDLESDGASQRTIEYRVPGEKLLANRTLQSRAKAVPIDLKFVAKRQRADASLENDELETSLWGVLRKNRVLVLDPRGRWELRYIKNAFQRDVAWDLQAILGPEEFAKQPFPQSRDQLVGLDLIVVTVDSFTTWNESQLRWLSDYVSDLGGGLILIDSARDPPNEAMKKDDVDWLPVEYSEETAPISVASISLEDAGIEQRAFAFEQDPASNRQLWEAFPAPRLARRVTPSAGAEVMVSGKLEDKLYPIVVSRRTGQGRVVYVGHDESWRWRYNVADLYHQRFWNQLAQWTMQAPYAVENDYVALDSGDRSYGADQEILIRARLRDAEQKPLESPKAFAVIEQNGVLVESLPLSLEGEGTGVVSNLVSGLAPGRYQVHLEVQGLPNEALDLSTEFIVRPSQDIEMQVLASNRGLLEQLALATDGKYYDESQADRINDAIQALQTGKIEQSRTLLWQSYPWFFAVMALLAVEWFLRKRAGFV